jgi:hypothetical protein
MGTLIKIRNEIVHYKSQWGNEMQRKDFFSSTLPGLALPKPPFVTPNQNFFPHQFLSAACAAWAVRTASCTIDVFYDQHLGIESPLKNYAEQLKV